MRRTNSLEFILIFFLIVLYACSSAPRNNPGVTQAAAPTEELIDQVDPSLGEAAEPTLQENLPDLTGETIVIYLIGDTSQPFTAITTPMRASVNDYVTYINANGGVYGATLEARFANSGGSEEGVLTAYERFIKEDENMLILLNYGSLEEAIYDRVNEDEISMLTLGLASGLSKPESDGYVYRLTPTYEEQFAFFLKFVNDNWRSINPGGETDGINLAYFAWDSDYGRAALTESTRAYASDLGIAIVAEAYLPMSETTSTTAAIFNAQMAGANVIYANMHDFGTANLLNDLNNLAIRDFFLVGGNLWSLGSGTMESVFEKGFVDQYYLPSGYAWWTDVENPAIQTVGEILKANQRGEAEKTTGRLIIQGGLDTALFAIQQAILADGYDQLSGRSVKTALDEFSDYQPLDGLTIVDFSDGERLPTLLQMRQVQGEEGVIVTVSESSDIPDLDS